MNKLFVAIGGLSLAAFFWHLSKFDSVAAKYEANKDKPLNPQKKRNVTQQEVVILEVDKPLNDLPFLFDDSIIKCYDASYEATNANKVFNVTTE